MIFIDLQGRSTQEDCEEVLLSSDGSWKPVALEEKGRFSSVPHCQGQFWQL